MRRGWLGESNRHSVSSMGAKTRKGFYLVSYEIPGIETSPDKMKVSKILRMSDNLKLNIKTNRRIPNDIDKIIEILKTYNDSPPPPDLESALFKKVIKINSRDFDRILRHLPYWLVADILVFPNKKTDTVFNYFTRKFLMYLMRYNTGIGKDKITETVNTTLKVIKYAINYFYNIDILLLSVISYNNLNISSKRFTYYMNKVRIFQFIELMYEGIDKGDLMELISEKYVSDLLMQLDAISMSILMSPYQGNVLCSGSLVKVMVNRYIRECQKDMATNLLNIYLNEMNKYISDIKTKPDITRRGEYIYIIKDDMSSVIDTLIKIISKSYVGEGKKYSTRVDLLTSDTLEGCVMNELLSISKGLSSSDLYGISEDVLKYPDIHDKVLRLLNRIL